MTPWRQISGKQINLLDVYWGICYTSKEEIFNVVQRGREDIKQE